MLVLDGHELLATALAALLEAHLRQRRKARLVQLHAHILRVADGAPRRRAQQHNRKTQHQPQRRALCGAAQWVERVIRLRRRLRLGQQVHRRAANDIARHVRIELDHLVEDRLGVLRARARHADGEEVRVRHGLRRGRSVERRNAHGAAELAAHQIRLDQIGEGLPQLLGRGLVIVAIAAGDVRARAAHHLDGERRLARVHRLIAAPAVQAYQKGHHRRQRQRQPVQPPQHAAHLAQQTAQVDQTLLVRPVNFSFVHLCPPSARGRAARRIRIHSHSRTRSHNRSRPRCRGSSAGARR